MAFLDSFDTPNPRVSPAMIVGAASPLWSFFAAAAAGGVAYWWMTRWARPVTLEAHFDVTPALALPEPAPRLEAPAEIVEETAGAVVAATLAAITEVEGSEASLQPPSEPPPEAAAIIAAAPEPSPEAEPSPKARPRKPTLTPPDADEA